MSWKFTGFDPHDGAAEYVDAGTGEAYYHRPSLRGHLCPSCFNEYVSYGKIYCPACAALQHALLRGGKDIT